MLLPECELVLPELDALWELLDAPELVRELPPLADEWLEVTFGYVPQNERPPEALFL